MNLIYKKLFIFSYKDMKIVDKLDFVKVLEVSQTIFMKQFLSDTLFIKVCVMLKHPKNAYKFFGIF